MKVKLTKAQAIKLSKDINEKLRQVDEGGYNWAIENGRFVIKETIEKMEQLEKGSMNYGEFELRRMKGEQL